MIPRFSCLIAGACMAIAAFHLNAEDIKRISLPPPQTTGGKPLMEALQLRQSIRELKQDPLPLPMLSDLLWAACGINRPDIQHRTAPSAMNSQEVEVYVAFADGAYCYEPQGHRMRAVCREDLRAKTGGQPFVTNAPIALIFVADLARLTKARPEDRTAYAGIDTAYISQNVYLYCASVGLGTVVHELGDRKALAEALHLRSEQKIVLAQAVGFPKIQSKEK